MTCGYASGNDEEIQEPCAIGSFCLEMAHTYCNIDLGFRGKVELKI